MIQLPAPWSLYSIGTPKPFWFRPCDGTAGGLVEALSQLPPGTAVETSGDDANALWYYPYLGYVTI